MSKGKMNLVSGKVTKILGYITGFSLLIFILALAYLISPTGKVDEYKKEIELFEKELARESIQKIESSKNKTVMVTKKVHRNSDDLDTFNLPSECEDQIIEIKRISIEDFDSLNPDDYRISKNCESRIDEFFKSSYSEEIKKVCNYNSRVMSLINIVSPEKEDSSADGDFDKIEFACSIGTYAYRKEVIEYMDKNLEKIDRLSSYMFAKLVDGIGEKKRWGKAAQNTIIKLPIVKEIIKETNRFIFVTQALKEIHENNKSVEELAFENDPLRDKLIEAAKSFKTIKKGNNE